MSLDEVRKIDAIGTETATGDTVLTIIDYWDWSDEKKHLLSLQEKINSYFEFIESGQLYEVRPQAVGTKLKINLVHRMPLTDLACGFMKHVAAVAIQSNVDITMESYIGSEVPSS